MFVSKPDESRTIPQIYFLQYIYFLSADNSSKWPNERTQKSIQFLFPASFIIDVLRLQLGKLFIVLGQGRQTDNTGKDNGNQYNLILLRSNHEKIYISFLMMYRFEIFHIFRFLLDPKEPIQAQTKLDQSVPVYIQISWLISMAVCQARLDQNNNRPSWNIIYKNGLDQIILDWTKPDQNNTNTNTRLEITNVTR